MHWLRLIDKSSIQKSLAAGNVLHSDQSPLQCYTISPSFVLIFYVCVCVYSSFKLFLELEPLLRDVIVQFHQSKYTSCLSTLETLRNSFMLDQYLANHISDLYTQIRNKALIQVSISTRVGMCMSHVCRMSHVCHMYSMCTTCMCMVALRV